MRRLYDSWRKCVCGHIIAHHRLDTMQACRMDDCDCEGFMPRKAVNIVDAMHAQGVVDYTEYGLPPVTAASSALALEAEGGKIVEHR